MIESLLPENKTSRWLPMTLNLGHEYIQDLFVVYQHRNVEISILNVARVIIKNKNAN